MEQPRGHHDPDDTGFEFTRRTLLRAGSTAGLGALAGCGDTGSSGSAPTSTPVPTPETSERVEGLIDDGLEIVESGIVADGDGRREFLRVLVRSRLESPIGLVTVSADLFDPQARFLGLEAATIGSLLPGEVFEGHIPYYYDDAAAYALRAHWSRRSAGEEALADVTLADHCLDDEGVRGTVANGGSSTVDRLRIVARFYDGNGHAVGTGTDTVTALGGDATTAFEVDMDAVYEADATSVTDYAVGVGDYGGGSLSVR